VDSLARQIKITGRAFPLFDIAHLIIQKPERYSTLRGEEKCPGPDRPAVVPLRARRHSFG
jgi:hypothetical protein